MLQRELPQYQRIAQQIFQRLTARFPVSTADLLKSHAVKAVAELAAADRFLKQKTF